MEELTGQRCPAKVFKCISFGCIRGGYNIPYVYIVVGIVDFSYLIQ